MPNCDFYAFGSDHEVILEYILEVMPCRIFELASRPGHKVSEFRSLGDFEQRFEITDWGDDNFTPLLLQLHPEGSGGKVDFKRIEHEPDDWSAHSFHYRTTGLGLVQLYLSGLVTGELRESHTNHNTEKRARSIAKTEAEVENWNWNVVNSFSRKLNRYIKRLCVRQLTGKRPVLLKANEVLSNAG